MNGKRFAKDFLAEIGAQEARREQVDLSSQKFGKLHFHSDVLEKIGSFRRLELDENVDIALRTKVVAQHGAEK
jgi:hypothetical protein